MKKTSTIEIVVMLSITAIIFIGFIVLVVLQPSIEARTFNECTGSNATYLDAVLGELRINECRQ